jgi:ribosome-associated protein
MTYQTQEISPTLTIDSPRYEYNSKELVFLIAEAAQDKKGEHILLLNVGEVSYLADYFVIITGFSRTQVRAIYNSIEDKVKDSYGVSPLRVQGQSEGNWVLVDYGDVMVHIMLPEDREYYKLEAFWGHAEKVVFPQETSE